MLEKALRGDRRYWAWVGFLILLIGVGFFSYLRQLDYGLGITGMSRNVSWALYIAQFTFLVGVAASAVMLVIPYYLHDYKAFGKITILGEFLAVASVFMCLTFIIVDLGQPARAFNMILYPTPSSILFWDMIVLNGYLVLNIVIGWTALASDKKSIPPPKWVKPLIYLSIPWAISIHTVTAFLYNGLPGRPLWLTAILAPRFLASAFASGPALLILLCMLISRLMKSKPAAEAIGELSLIVTYAMSVNVFFILLEVFTAFYSQIPDHMEPFEYLFVGLDGRTALVPWMWASVLLAVASLVVLLVPKLRANSRILALACTMVFLSLWIDKGMGLIVGGFVPTPLGTVTEYFPTLPEISITLGVWAVGALIVTVLFKIALSVRPDLSASH
jgi:molybdopterin-containing oxidoreductase family membrane subunit